ncbi:hypothetical protein F5884DRAFT_854896 [Xylogone sp. PMI_703]|nr:hypothetical protein F5884DRAFT_854896 [Xylogone sp. PMI_703]
MQGQGTGQPLEIDGRSSESTTFEPAEVQDASNHDRVVHEAGVSRATQRGGSSATRSLSGQSMHEGLITRQGAHAELPAFQFINERDLHGPENVELRRAMRAHVRRDTTVKRQRDTATYQSRFSRGKKILKKKNPSTSNSAQNSSSLSVSPEVDISEFDTKASTSNKEERLVIRRTRSKQSVPVHVFRVTPTSRSKATNQHSTTILDARPDNIQEIQFPMQSLHTPNVAATTPYALLMGSDAPTLYMQAHHWPFMHSIQGNRPATSVYMPTSAIPIPNVRTRRPCLLKSASINRWIVNSVDYFIFKDKLIKWVNGRLSDPEKGTDETTVGGILLLTSLELCRGNSVELKAHMVGLERIVAIRGGLYRMSDINHFRLKVQLIDLLVAAILGTEPQFPALGPDRPIRPPPQLHGLIQIPDSPLYGHQRLQDVLLGSPFCSQSISLLQQMQDFTRALVAEPSSFLSPLLPTFSDLSPSHILNLNPHPSLLDMIALTSAIYVQFFSSNSLSVSVSTLATALMTYLECPIHDETWMKYPGILLWIVLTGSATTAGEKGERSLFLLWATRLGLISVWGWWEEMRSSVECFARVRKGR